MTFDDWSNIVTANAYWMHLVLVMVILVVFYRQYRDNSSLKIRQA